MKKPYTISAAQKTRLKRVITNYNQTIKRAIRAYGTKSEVLPNKLNLNEVLNNIHSASEYRSIYNEISQLRSYQQLKPAKLGDRETTEYTIKQIEKKEVKIRAQAQKIFKEAEKKATQAGRFPTDSDFIYQEIKYTHGDPKNYERLLTWLSTSNSRGKGETWRQNYLKALDAQYGNLAMAGEVEGYSDAVRMNQELYRKIASMNIADFLAMMLAFPSELEIGFVYNQDMLVERVERIYDIWNKI